MFLEIVMVRDSIGALGKGGAGGMVVGYVIRVMITVTG
jgi:hypothetical protein